MSPESLSLATAAECSKPDFDESLAATHPPRRISSETLLGSQRELVIVHNGREYRLRLTQNGKLLLTA
ncbi:MAG: hemin uptake protein HemP [Betaproteobacteria bacterium]